VPKKANIIVNFKKIKKISPYIFGNNILAFDPCRKKRENWKNCSNDGWQTNWGGGFWTPKLKKPNSLLVNLAKEIKTSVLRFPGGCGTHLYNWKEAIGPLEKRPMFQFGIDEFMELCKVIGAKPIITLSYFTGTNQDLMGLIEYLNAPLGTNPNGDVSWAEIRAENGHPEPYNVEWFEFGNAVWHGNHRDIIIVEPEEYANRFLECYQLFKEIDSKIKLGIVIRSGFNGLYWWDRNVLNIVKDNFDFAIVHFYRPGYHPNCGEISTEELFKITFSSSDQVKYILEKIEEDLKKVTGKEEVPIAITEFNGFTGNVPYKYCLGNALFVADLLRIFISTKVPILCANYFKFSRRMVYVPKFLTGRKWYKRPDYYVYELYTKHFGNILLESNVESPTYCQKGYRCHGSLVLPNCQKMNENLQKSNFEKTQFIKLSFQYLPSCVELERYSDYYIKLKLNCKERKGLGLYLQDRILVRNNWIYSCEFELKIENLNNFDFVLQIKDQNYKVIERHGFAGNQLVNELGWIKTGFDFLTSENIDFLKIMLLIKKKEEIVGNVYIKNLKIKELGPAPQFNPTPYISAIASTNEKKDRIYIIVINKNLNEPMETRIEINGFNFSPIVHAWVLNGPSVDATNEDCQENVKIRYRRVKVNVKDNSFSFTFEPHSVTALEIFEKEKRIPIIHLKPKVKVISSLKTKARIILRKSFGSIRISKI